MPYERVSPVVPKTEHFVLDSRVKEIVARAIELLKISDKGSGTDCAQSVLCRYEKIVVESVLVQMVVVIVFLMC